VKNGANNTFRPSDRPLTEYEQEQIALRKNLARLKAERLAREKASRKRTSARDAYRLLVRRAVWQDQTLPSLKFETKLH
jgi:hypothetical protein